MKIKIKNNNMSIWSPFIFLSFFCLLVGEGFINILGVPHLFKYIAPCFICVFMWGLYILNKKKPSKVALTIAIIYLTIFISGYLHGVLVSLVLPNFIGGFAMCFVCDYWLKNKYELFLRIVTKVLVVLVIINFILIIMYPDGMYTSSIYTQNWLLGYKNSCLAYIMPAIMLVSIQSFKKHQKVSLSSILFFVICCVGLFIADSMAAFVVVVMYSIVIVILVNYSKKRFVQKLLKMMDIKALVVMTVLVTILLFSIESIDWLQSGIGNFMGNLGRDATFTGRVGIWLVSLELITKSPWIGYGVINPVEYVNYTKNIGGTHAHNYILNIMIMGGLICLLEHIFLYRMTIKQIISHKNYYAYTMGLVIGLYFLVGITNINFYSELFNALFIFSYYIIERESSKKMLGENEISLNDK